MTIDTLPPPRTVAGLAAFVDSLRADFLANREGWANWITEDYIFAIARCMQDHAGRRLPPNEATEMSCKTFAEILLIGAIYE